MMWSLLGIYAKKISLFFFSFSLLLRKLQRDAIIVSGGGLALFLHAVPILAIRRYSTKV